MPWHTMTNEQLANALGIDLAEVKAKKKLIGQIRRARVASGMSQLELGRRVGVSQARIAKIESGIGTGKITFDALFNILQSLGYEYHVSARPAKKVA